MRGGAGRLAARGAIAVGRGIPASEILDDDDLARYAHTLFSRLRDADDRGVDTVIAVLPPAVGLGHAIRDRLTKAPHRRRSRRP